MTEPPNRDEPSNDARVPTETANLHALDATPHARVFDRDAPETVKLHLDADEGVPSHRHPGMNVVLYLVSGRLELALGGDVHDLRAGDAIRFDGDQEIAPEAREESVAFLVFAPTVEG